ncbi:MAG: putative Ig domain-containing protein [Streptosporangiaceae bacterium]
MGSRTGRAAPAAGAWRAGLSRGLTVLAAACLAGGWLGAGGSAVAQAGPPASAAGRPALLSSAAGGHRPAARSAAPADFRRACALSRSGGQTACMVLVRTNVPQRRQAAIRPDAAPSGYGYGPPSLQAAYDLPSAADGVAQTVAVVDAYDDPDAESDLAVYRAAWGLPPCGTGCFQKINQNGGTAPPPAAANSGWATEESLDVDMVSAICPNCRILLVEAGSTSIASLGTAVNTAVSHGADYVSNSYGAQESGSDLSDDSAYFNHPGVAITASAGDDGYGVTYPAASQYVTAVGGTTLSPAANSRGWTETVWGSSSGGEGTGSGCSAFDPKPSWQTDTGCSRRTANDVAAVANPNTGVAVYDTYDQHGWLEVGGTSAAAPIIASVFALAGPPAAGAYPSSFPYARPASLYDVTSGANGRCGSYLCTAETGYDGPTGWGTPDGIAAFSKSTGTAGKVTVTSPGNQSGPAGKPVSLQITASDSVAGQKLSYAASGLPAGLSISATTGRIAGTPTTAGVSSVKVTAKDGTGASGSASFSWTVTSAASGCAARQLLGNPDFGTGRIAPWTASAGVLTHASAGVPAYSGSWVAWLDGYGSAHVDRLAQTVTLPSGCRSATLSFWLDISTNDPASGAYDTLAVQVLSGGRVLATLARYSNLNARSGYVHHVLSLTSYIGQTVRLRFTGTETLSGHTTSFFEQCNALNVS